MTRGGKGKGLVALILATAVVTGLASAVGIASATSATDVQANDPQVADTNVTDVRFPTNKQNEPAIAVAPDGDHLIAGSNDEQEQPPCGPGPVRGDNADDADCSFFPGVGTNGVYLSSDGGQHWTNQGLIDDQPTWKAANIVSDGDPTIVFGPTPDRTGVRAWYVSLGSRKAGPPTAPEFIVSSYSDDFGEHWSTPTIAGNAHGNIFNDKNSVAVDDDERSPFYGRVYVGWTQFRDIPGAAEPVMVTYSTDGGDTWARPNQLSAAHNNGIGGRQGTAITTDAGGRVYFTWEDTDRIGPEHVISLSDNGARTWTKPRFVARVHDLDDPIPGTNFRTDSFATIAADHRTSDDPGAGNVYLAWADKTEDGGRILVATSSDRGRSWSAPDTVSGGEGYAFFQGLDVAPSGRVDVAYQVVHDVDDATTFGIGNALVDAYYASKPAGGSWTAPQKVSSESSDPAASAQNNLERQFWGDYNTLVSGADTAWFIYTDSRNGEGCAAVDNYQQTLAARGAAHDEERGAEREPKAPPGGDAVVKPAPPSECGVTFGDTDVFVSVIPPA